MTLVQTDVNAFTEIVSRYKDKLKRYIHRLTNVSHEEQEDLLQEVFIKVYKNSYNIDPSLSFSAWMYRITYNHVISSHRKKCARPSVISWDDKETLLNKLKADEDVHLAIEKKEQQAMIYNAIDKLNIKYKDIILLKYIEEKNYEEIADILKIPPGTVATRLHRAKKSLKKYIEKHEHHI